ncbi:MAG: histidine phosphatase family protein [Alphaproteobacteria bacterium]|nr:histidine phosphatase family protein [Alphaproteobacteria bacterium]
MKHIYLFRHGETPLNAAHILQGHIPHPELTQNGIMQARSIAEKLKNYPVQILYSSPLKRARQTADIVNEIFNIPVFEDDRLKEIHLGDLDGSPVETVKYLYPHLIDSFFSDDEKIIDTFFPNGESYRQVSERAKSFFSECIANCPYRHIGIAAHGMLLKYALYGLGFKLMSGAPDNASIAYITYDNGKWIFNGFL